MPGDWTDGLRSVLARARAFLRPLVGLFGRRGEDAELDAEIRAHLEMAAEEYEAQGMSSEDARRAARRDFGGVDQVKERHREARYSGPGRWIRGLFRDAGAGARSLRKRPAFSAAIVLTLGLGIGATAAVFSLVQGVLLTPPPYEDPEELALVLPTRTDGVEGESPSWTAEQWLLWQEESRQFESIGAYRWAFNFLVSENGSEALEGLYVTHDYFRTLGLEPALGRLFDDAETGLAGSPQAVIIGHDLWMDRYDGDPTILGQSIRLGDAARTVVGVMPPGIRFLPSPARAAEPGYDVDGRVDFWWPIQPGADSDPSVLQRRMWNVVGRLADGVSPEAAADEIGGLVSRQAELNPAYAGMAPRIEGLPDFLNRDGRRILLPLFAAAALVLLIACGNTAGLLFVRGIQRRREYGVRAAIGAGRADLLRLVTLESVLLAMAGAGLGLLLAFGIVEGIKAVGGTAIPRLDAVETGWLVLVFGVGSASATAIVAGLVPALRAARESERGGVGALGGAGLRTSAGRNDRRMLAGVTMAQAALTLTLLVGAGLLVRTMDNLAGVDSGYETTGIMTVSVTLPDGGGDWDAFHRTGLDRVRALPEVEGAAFAWGVPLTGNLSYEDVVVEGEGTPASLPLRGVTPGYFDLLGQRIVAGRDFRDSDADSGPRVAVVNQAFMDRFVPSGAAVGRTLDIVGFGDELFRIVGVVSNGRTDDLSRAAQPEVYDSMWQIKPTTKHLVVRSSGAPEAVISGVRQALRGVDPLAAVEDFKTLDRIRAESLASRRFAMQLLIGFAVVACALTLGGIYGVLSLSVASRRKEIAIRSAVGADRGRVFGLVLQEGARVVAVGVVVGAGASLALTRALDSFLYGVEPTDPVTLLVVGTLFTGVAFLACWIPARRAAGIEPMGALREE